MLRIVKNGLALSVLALSLIACQNEASTGTVEGTETTDQTTASVAPKGANTEVTAQTTIQPQKPAAQQAVDPATAAVMDFAEKTHNFGTIKQGEKVTHTFKFTNTSENPLTITNARGSCGCTVPEWPKDPIAPGEEGEIVVTFNSENKMGSQTKNVTLTANTLPQNTILEIKADVVKE